MNYEKNEATEYWNLIKSKQYHSIGFGLNVWDKQQYDWEIIEWLRDGIERSKKAREPFPCYYAPEQILKFPLADYYKKIGLIYSMKDALEFFKNTKHETWDNQVTWDKSMQEINQKTKDYERKLKLIDQDCVSFELEDMFNNF